MMQEKVSWYDLGRRTGRDPWILLHPHYSAWMLSYIVIGSSLGSTILWDRLMVSLLVFFLGLQAGHLLDEAAGHPLRTGISDRYLYLGAATCFLLAWSIGIPFGLAWMGPIILAWALPLTFLAAAYNLSVRHVHSDYGFAVIWGMAPSLFGYWIQSGSISVATVLLGLSCFAITLVQRNLSFRARFVRRKIVSLSGEYKTERSSREMNPISKAWLLEPLERSLKLLNIATVLLAFTMLGRFV